MKPVTASGELEPGPANTGMVYLLVDRQENLDQNAFYYHEVRKITSENGLQNGASISTTFNPAFEKLTFHSIQVLRAGTASNRLDRSVIELAPREKDPIRASYDPTYSAEVVLEDVRVGDLIEFSYTRQGANPLFRGKYAGTYSLQWDSWVGRNVIRLLYPAGRKIAFQTQNGAGRPTVTTVDGMTELSLEEKNVPGLTVEDDVPNDYLPRRRLALSEFQSWAELVQWALPLFDFAATSSPELAAEIGKLDRILDPDLRVVTALQFVENEIRSVNVDSWIGDRALTAPAEVLRRRSGDDKDKAVLLLALLRGLGLEAAPALVSDFERGRLRERLPSPDLFPHVIVQVRLGGSTHWLDPWRDGQRGPLTQIYVAPFRYALLLRAGESALSEVSAPPASEPLKKVVETYRVPAPEGSGELDVVSDYKGLAADRTRLFFRENTREEIQKRYLDYYARSFPAVKARKLVWFEELPGVDGCRVTESYTIPQLWQLSDDKSRYLLTLTPGDISAALGSPAAAQRRDPLKQDYPNHVIQEMNIEMFDPWPLETKATTIANNFFRLRNDPTGTGAHIQLNYSYEALKDRIEPKEFASYNEAVNQAKDSLGYTFRYVTPAQQEKARQPTTFNWAVGAAGLCFLGGASLLAFVYFRASRLASPLPPPTDAGQSAQGIGGWLILLAIGQVLRPLGYIKTGHTLSSSLLDTNSWRLLTDPIEATYQSWWAPTLLFEFFFNLAGLVFCVLLLFLFFQKRVAWPRCFAVFLLMNVGGVLLDTFLVRRLGGASPALAVSVGSIVGAVLVAAIWIPYVYLSQRVRATFRY